MLQIYKLSNLYNLTIRVVKITFYTSSKVQTLQLKREMAQKLTFPNVCDDLSDVSTSTSTSTSLYLFVYLFSSFSATFDHVISQENHKIFLAVPFAIYFSFAFIVLPPIRCQLIYYKFVNITFTETFSFDKTTQPIMW